MNVQHQNEQENIKKKINETILKLHRLKPHDISNVKLYFN